MIKDQTWTTIKLGKCQLLDVDQLNWRLMTHFIDGWLQSIKEEFEL